MHGTGGSTVWFWSEPVGAGRGPVHGPKGPPAPTVSAWGMAALVLLVMVAGTVVLRRVKVAA